MMKTVYLLPALALGVALVGCDRPDDGRTVGQKVDEAVVTTERKTEELRADAKGAAQDAKEATQNAGARAGEAMSDATITAEVKAALAGDPQLSALRIDVDTRNGVVTLTGPAPDEQSRSRATQLAAAPKGVTKVDNQLAVNRS